VNNQGGWKQMKKKVIVSVVAGIALLMANPIANQADAASNNTKTEAKVYYYSGNSNSDQINQLVKINLQNYQVKQSTSQPVQIKVVKKATPVASQQQKSQPVQAKVVKKATPVTSQQPAVKQPQASQQPNQTNQSAYKLSAYEQKVVDLTNQQRVKNGLPALKVDLSLSKVAREKSSDMQKNNYFSHTSPSYGSPFDMMKKFGITYKTAGENIAKGQRSPEEVVNAWMNSAGHRQNILSSNFTHIGVGHVANGNYWTQQFIGK
jgi:uncharacterized YkwD family protein